MSKGKEKTMQLATLGGSLAELERKAGLTRERVWMEHMAYTYAPEDEDRMIEAHSRREQAIADMENAIDAYRRAYRELKNE